jgi:hypothetical protein
MRALFALLLVLLALLVAAVLLLVRPAWSETRCTTYTEKTLNRLHTLCTDGTRAVSTFNKTLSRWESTVTPPPSSNRSKIHLQPKAPRR